MKADILSQIHNKMPSLSKGQRRIAEYILSSYDKAAFQTASVLGRTVQVSESTVVRFACELGYEGYPQMQKALQEMVLSRLTTVQRMEVTTKRISQDHVLDTVLHGDMERIRQSCEAIDKAAFQGAVNALLHAEHIYIIGIRSSSVLASFLSYYLHYMFDNVHLITSASDCEVLEGIVRISPRDTLMGISFPRYSSATLRAMIYGKKAGARTVALTDCASSPLSQHAEFLLTAKSDMVSFADSLVAPMSVINALLAALSQKKKQELRETLDKLEDIWDQYHVYEKIDE